MDVISSFLSDCCTIGEGEIQSSLLYNAYCGWTADNGEYKMSHTKFSTEILKRDGISKVRKKNGFSIVGLSLNDEFNFSV